MKVLLYHGKGNISDTQDTNVNPVSVSMEIYPGLRTWHSGKPLVGQRVPIILGQELPSQQYQFVIGRSSIIIANIGYEFWGEQGYIFAQKDDGSPLEFQEWEIRKIATAAGVPEGVYSQDPPLFKCFDSTVWGCYSATTVICPEYGQLSPVIDISTTFLEFKKVVPPEYASGAKLDVSLQLQTVY